MIKHGTIFSSGSPVIVELRIMLNCLQHILLF